MMPRATKLHKKVRVEVEQELGMLSNHPARVLVYVGDQLVATVVGKVERQQGADGGYYSAVTLKILKKE